MKKGFIAIIVGMLLTFFGLSSPTTVFSQGGDTLISKIGAKDTLLAKKQLVKFSPGALRVFLQKPLELVPEPADYVLKTSLVDTNGIGTNVELRFGKVTIPNNQAFDLYVLSWDRDGFPQSVGIVIPSIPQIILEFEAVEKVGTYNLKTDFVQGGHLKWRIPQAGTGLGLVVKEQTLKFETKEQTLAPE